MAREVEIITQTSDLFTPPAKEPRVGCRGLIVRDGKILLSHETNMSSYMTPGGGLEPGEEFAECCRRELLEESGYIVEVGEQLFTVDEFVYDREYHSHYFLCEIIGEGERTLTQLEIEHGLEPCWMDLDEAIELFSDYHDTTPGKASMYKREYTVLTKLKKILSEIQ